MDDSFAREGVLARCNVDREATADDLECVNARRAAAAIAAQGEAEQRKRLDAQSEARLLAARQRTEAQLAAERQAALAAEAERQVAYEAQWDENQPGTVPASDGGSQAVGQTTPAPELPVPASSATPMPSLEPINLPPSVRSPLTTVTLPRSAKPIEYEAPGPQLEEIVLPSRLRTAD